MQFFITAYDGKDKEALNRRMCVRSEHLSNIQRVKRNGSVVCAGGITNQEGIPIGSFLIMDFATRELLDAYLVTEPYIIHKVWQDVRIETCNAVIINDEFVGK